MLSRRSAALLGLMLLAGRIGISGDMVRGLVLLDDVIPPSSAITVRLVCGESVVATVTADPDGRFAVEEAAGDPRPCRLEASATGYEPDSTPVERVPKDPAIGALALRRAGKWNGYALSVTSLAVNSEAKEHFQAATNALRRGGQVAMAEAEDAFARATEADAEFAEAWFQLGRMRLARHEVEAGREALRRAVEADPWYVSPYRPLLLLELGEENWPLVVALSSQLLELNPYLADVHYYRGIAALELGDLEKAKGEVEAIAGGPEGVSFALLHELRGRILQRQGLVAQARAAFETYLARDPEGAAAGEVRYRLSALGAR